MEPPRPLKKRMHLVDYDEVRQTQQTPRVRWSPGPAVPLGELVLEERIGRGGMGEVWRAREPAGERVAVKLLAIDWATDPRGEARLLREHAALEKLDHPAIVRARASGRAPDGRPWFSMELVQGARTLSAAVRDGLGVERALDALEDVAEALGHAHRLGVFHRDVKPANILLSPEGRAKLTDFGIARKTANESMASLTATGQGLGTMVYMPPEQISEAKAVDPRADIYSLGVTMFELIAGIPPFKIETVEELVRASYEDAAPLTSMRSDCPPQVATIVQHMLKKEPHERPANPQLVADTLKRVREQLYPQHRFDHLFPRALTM